MLTEQVIATLQAIPDQWGGELSKKPAEIAIAKVGQILSELEKCRMPYPSIEAGADGSIVLSWDTLNRGITVTIESCGDISFLTSIKQYSSIGEEIGQIDSEGFVTDISTIHHMMAWLVSDYAAEA